MNYRTAVTAEDIKDAYKRISKYIRRTPHEYSHYYSGISGGYVRLKLENMQVTGSFKVRGALNAVGRLTDKEFERGIIAVSAGNHALGIGYACDSLSRTANIILPKNASQVKVESLKQFNITAEFCGETYDEAEAVTLKRIEETGEYFVSPYNDPDIIAGAGTVGLEIMEDFGDTEIILTPIGGGGLLSGLSIAVKEMKPEVRIFGVQTDASPSGKASLDAGMITDVELHDSIAEGLHGNFQPGAITFDLLKEHVEDILLVSEDEIKAELPLYIQYHHNLLEGSSAVVPAALRRYSSLFKGKKITGVISGANMDINLLAEIIGKYS